MVLALRHAGTRRLRPPRADVRLDVRVANDGDAPAWALLPDTLADPPRAPAGAVWSLAAWELGGGLRAGVLLRATGDAGWFGLLVPAHGEVTVAELPFAWWGELPHAVELAAVLAADLAVDGTPVAERLGLTARADTGARLDATALDDPAAVSAAVSGTPGAPLAVTWTATGDARARAELD